MLTVILSNDLNSTRTKTNTGFRNTWIARMLRCVFIRIIVYSYSTRNRKSHLGGE